VSRQLSIAEARNRFAQVVHDTERTGPVEVMRRGQPVAVILSIKDYRRLTVKKGGFWQAYERLHRDPTLPKVDVDPAIFEGLREELHSEGPNPWL
jgi:prevent-host-death family protein